MTKTDKSYVAVVGDAIRSRALPAADRRDLQRILKAALQTVNRRWRRDVAARFGIALGDQFEGLLTGGRAVWEIAHFLRAELGRVDWVIACGRGPISTPPAPTAVEMDGPCFHAARDALAGAKERGLVFAFAGFGEEVTALAAYYSALYWSWTARQRETAAALRVVEPAAVAERLGVDRSAVSHLVRRLRWDLVTAGDAAFRRSLEAR